MDVHQYELIHSLMVLGGVIAITAGVVAIARGRLGEGLARWLESYGRPEGLANTRELEELRERVATLPALESRVNELEERLDFAERLLSRSKDPAALSEGEKL